MLRIISKILTLTILSTGFAFANPQLILDGEFQSSPSNEARFAFLQYEYAKEEFKDYSANSQCHILLDLDDNRLSPSMLETMRKLNMAEYRDRSYCAFIMSDKQFLSKNVNDAELWIKQNQDTVVYRNIHASILDNIIEAGVERGFNASLCGSMDIFMNVYHNEMNKEKEGASALYSKECKHL